MVDKPVINLADLPMRETSKGSRYAAKAARIGGVIGMQQLGAQYMVVPAGKAAYPRHAHHKNEELFVVLEGNGEYRCGDNVWPVSAGDVISAPAGFGESAAHQLRNTSAGDLKYLAISTRHDPDVMEYPDSGKFYVASGVPDGQGMLSAKLSFMGRRDMAVDYWDGEDIGEEE